MGYPRRGLRFAGLLGLALMLAGGGEVRAEASPVSSQPEPVTSSTIRSETYTLASRILGETRRINVYVPPGYREHPEQRLPVLYMPDGGMAEDFPHVVEAVDAMVGMGTMRPLIVVGIENTQRRRDMTGPTTVDSDKRIAPQVGGSAAFRQFIRQELMPDIRQRYRTTAETAVIGESLAGLFVMETFFREPDLFDRYIAFSPSLWWNDEALVKQAGERLQAPPKGQKTLYFSSANEDNIAPAAARLAETLQAHAPANLAWSYRPMPDEFHDTIYRAAAPKALRTVFAAAAVH